MGNGSRSPVATVTASPSSRSSTAVAAESTLRFPGRFVDSALLHLR